MLHVKFAVLHLGSEDKVVNLTNYSFELDVHAHLDILSVFQHLGVKKLLLEKQLIVQVSGVSAMKFGDNFSHLFRRLRRGAKNSCSRSGLCVTGKARRKRPHQSR